MLPWLQESQLEEGDSDEDIEEEMEEEGDLIIIDYLIIKMYICQIILNIIIQVEKSLALILMKDTLHHEMWDNQLI